MSDAQEQTDPIPVAGEEYGQSANFESIVDKYKTWKSTADTLQLKLDYDQLLKELWWPAGTRARELDSDPDFKERPPVVIERKFFSYHWLCSVRQKIRLDIEPLLWNDGAVGVAALETLLDRLDAFIISAGFKDIVEVKHIAAGASFDVSLARASKESNIPADRKGCNRPQWRKDDWLALKRGLFPMSPQQHKGTNREEQMYKAILQEVRILTHPAIREHPNFIRLFGVAWHEHTGDEGERIVTPVLVQDYATHGDLLGFLRAKSTEHVLTREMKTQFIIGVAEGLQALHALGVIHGDVKCENILVSWDASQKTFVPKLSDFGFSIVKTVREHKYVHIPSMVSGFTKRYLAPEIWTPAETPSVSPPTDLTIRTDIYSFGLAILTISLDGKDVFEVFTKLCVDQGLISVGAGTDWVTIVDAVVSKTKTDVRLGGLFLQALTALISKQDAEFAGRVYPIVSKMLHQDPEQRLANLLTVKSHFSQKQGAVEMADLPLERLSIAEPSATDSASRLLPHRYERFLIDNKPTHAFILDARIGYNFLLNTISSTHEARLLRDWLGKAATVLNPDDLAHMTVEKRTSSAFCAHQAAISHIYGFGTTIDPPRALELLAASARAGYITSLSMVQPFHEAFSLVCPEDLPVQEALKQMVSVGPCYGFVPWALACRQLRNSDQTAFDEALQLLQNNGYLELGESGLTQGDSAHDQLRGDPRHCCFEYGTFSFALYCIPRLPEKLFNAGIEVGWIPKASRNENGESLLYMCCRAGDHAKVLMLLEYFEWARNDATVATNQGRLPLHWVCMIEPAFSEKVIVALIENGADSTAVDEDGLTAIGYAIMYGREDVALILLEQGSLIQPLVVLKRHANLAITGKNNLTTQSTDSDFRGHTICAALQNNFFTLGEKLMQQASDNDLIQALKEFGGCRQEIRYTIHGKDAKNALEKAFKFAARYLEGRENASEIWAGVIVSNCRARATDVLQAILDSKIIPELDASMHTVGTLATAAQWSPLIFDGILGIVPKMEVGHAAQLLAFIIQQTRGPCQLEIVQSLLRKLEAQGLVHEVVNYVLPQMCSSSCAEAHDHHYDHEMFTVAVIAGSFDVAELLAPYHRHQTGQQVTTMFHVLANKKVDGDILQQLEFLLRLGPGHSDSLCEPFQAITVLHVIVQTFKIFPSDSLYRDVLGMLLEEYADQIDQTNQTGSTALQLAAVIQNMTAVRMLLEYGADPAPEAQAGSAYEFALRRLYVELLNGNLLHKGGRSITATAWTEDASKEVESNRTVAGRIELQLDIMEMLCDAQGRPISERILYDENKGDIFTGNDWLDKKGLSIRLRRLKGVDQLDELLAEFEKERENFGDRINLLLCRRWVLFIAMDDAWHDELEAELAARGGSIPTSLSPFDYGRPRSPTTHGEVASKNN